jgi:predicted ATPase/transcriptional regulator with XRE-family HTH domain
MGALETPFGRELRRWRLRRGLSQEALAERAGLAPSAVAALENGARRRPYPRTVRVLADALELTAHERAGLTELVGRAAGPSDPSSASMPMPLAPRLAALPAWQTTLVGREADLGAIGARLDPMGPGVRLLTLVGPGGVGKTRLAVAAAAAFAPRYPDGVAFVDLAPLRAAPPVAAAIAHALDLHESGGQSARELLKEHLGARNMLLVLDNFEHLLDAAPLLPELLGACPALTLLVTSRTALRVRGEQRFAVPPLATPSAAPAAAAGAPDVANSPAVQLFVARAGAVAADFALTENNAAAVAELCRRLDGIPLAIELAAARVPILSPAALLRRLEHRLSLLTRGAADLPGRQQTLRATLAWSHDLLDPATQALFRRLAVFAGGWTLEAAESICADVALLTEEVLNHLQVLVDSSLIQAGPVEDSGDNEPRFAMLETIRAFALERLEEAGEALAVRRRHLAWCLALVQPVKPGPIDQRQLGRLAPEHTNLQAALHVAIADGAVEEGLWLAAALWMPWYLRGSYGEGRAWLSQLLALPGAEVARQARAHALNAAGHLAYCQGEYATAERLLSDARTLADGLGDDRLGGAVRHNLAHVARWRGDLPGARALYASALARFRRLGDRPWEATVLVTLAALLHEQGDLEQAGARATASLTFFKAEGNTWGMARALYALGLVASGQGDHARARALLESSVTLHRQVGDHQARARSLLALATEMLSDDEAGAAWPLFAESLALAEKTGDRLTLARGLEGVAGLLAEARPDRAVRLAGAADAVRAGLGVAVQPGEWDRRHTWQASARRALGAQGYAAAWMLGQELTAPRAVAEALEGFAAPTRQVDRAAASLAAPYPDASTDTDMRTPV